MIRTPDRRRAIRPEERSHLIYHEERLLLGAVSHKGSGYLALDRNGRRLGAFPSLSAACAVIHRTARSTGGTGER
jgi:hypothetical protein